MLKQELLLSAQMAYTAGITRYDGLKDGLRSFAYVPIILDKNLTGALNFSSLNPYGLSLESLQAVAGLTGPLSALFQNVKLHGQLLDIYWEGL